jgi:two-component system, NtrC family, response regulator AtoC
MWKILILTDEKNRFVEVLYSGSKKIASLLSTADSTESLQQILKNEHYDAVLIPTKREGLSFESLLKDTLCEFSPLPLIITYGDDYAAGLATLEIGAYDYLHSPDKVEAVSWQLQVLFTRADMYPSHLRIAPKQETKPKSSTQLIIKSPKMKKIFGEVRRLAQFSTTVLITGESGTGKELIAKELHNYSPRRACSFIAINCGAIPEALMESELFGHRKGSFTDALRDKKGLFEEADGGTIFLDEIGELPSHLQVKLLRVLQEQAVRRIGDDTLIPINVRVVAATLRDLEQDVAEGRFRDDLFFRLNVVSIELPPLRERREEIEPLVRSFMKKHNKRLKLNIKQIEADALKKLIDHSWRGNVRELENCIERAMVLSESGTIDLASLPEQIVDDKPPQAKAVMKSLELDGFSIKKKTRELEIALMTKALKKTGGNRTQAAKLLEISHRTLLYKIKEYCLYPVNPPQAEV